MKKIFFYLILFMYTSSNVKAESFTLIDGVQYFSMKNQVVDVPPVIEFFSFYCGPCYLFSSKLQVDDLVNNSLPNNMRITKYHISSMGELGEELTIAWSIAIVLNIQDDVENLIFSSQKIKSLNTREDIKSIFLDLGISSEFYDDMRQSKKVKEITEIQNTAARNFNVTSTPSFYILGKYKINNNGVSEKSLDGYAKEFSDIIVGLLNENR
ncbi:DsbA family protein [Providencia rettgeri]